MQLATDLPRYRAAKAAPVLLSRSTAASVDALLALATVYRIPVAPGTLLDVMHDGIQLPYGAWELARTAQRLGFTASSGRLSSARLPDLALPALIMLRNDRGPDHAVLLVDCSDERVLFSDFLAPEPALVDQPLALFLERWTGELVTVEPPSRIVAALRRLTAPGLAAAVARHRLPLLTVTLAFCTALIVAWIAKGQ